MSEEFDTLAFERQQHVIQLRQDTLLASARKVFATTDGRAIAHWLQERCGFHEITFSDNHAIMSYKEGRRSAAKDLDALLRMVLAPQEMTQIEREAADREAYFEASARALKE